MDGFSDEEFYEARDDISSVSGSDSADEEASEVGKQGPRQDLSKPPRHKQPPSQWFSGSRYSVWQDGPKSIQERRRLLYEQFGLVGRRDDGTEGEETSSISTHDIPGGKHERPQIRGIRFGISSPARKGLGRGLGTPDNVSESECSVRNGKGSISPDGLVTGNFGTVRLHPGESSKSLTDDASLALGRSRSDSAALSNDGKIGNPGLGATNQIARCAGASPQHVPGIERLMQTSGAVLREGKSGPFGSKPPTGSRATIASKSAPANLHNLAAHVDKLSRGSQSRSSGGYGGPPNRPSGPSTTSPRNVVTQSKLISDLGSPLSSQKAALAEIAVFDSPNGQVSSDSFGGITSATGYGVGLTETNQDWSPSVDEKHDIMCKIKDLDSGKEFLIDDLGIDGDPTLRDLDTGKELTLDEFESSLGLSPVMQEVRRRERAKDNLDEDEVVHGHDANATNKKKKKKSLWTRTMKGVAKTVGGVSKSKSHQDPSKVQTEDSRAEGGGEDKEDSIGKGIDKEGSIGKVITRESLDYKRRKPQLTRAERVSNNSLRSLRHKSPERVKAQVYKKNHKDLSDLNMGQEFQAHQGAIWTMEFSLDGRYLASAGQDRVVQIREIIDYPFPREIEREEAESGVKPERAGVATPEHSQHSQEGSQGRRGSLRGSVSKKKPVKSNSLSKLPKLFWLAETAICSFRGHTEDVLDLSWSRSQFLLSSSMDKTVRLWHISYGDCLRVFTHNDYVTCIEFSPTDDRYFLSGSLDDKVRIWSIPDLQVVDWSDVREMVTAASYSPDGKRAVIGTYKGTCRFYNTTGHKLQLYGHIDVKSAQGKKSRGKKITGLQFVPGRSDKILVTSNDSRVRVYDGMDLSCKFKGLRNVNSQISAMFNRTGEYIVSASEDSRVYIWSSGLQDGRGSRKDKPQAYEHFPSSNVSIAVPWPGMDPQPFLDVAKEDQSELVTSSSRHSGNNRPLRSPLRCSPSSSSSSRSDASTRSESGVTSESVGECKSEQSISSVMRNGSGWDMTDEEVTSRRSDVNGSYVGHFDMPETPAHKHLRESSSRDYGIQPSLNSPSPSLANDSPPLEQSSLRSPGPSFFAEITPKSSATWPEEKLPHVDSVRSQGGSWSACSPSQDILSTELSPEGSTTGEGGTVAVASWGLVIVTASLSGEIRTFQNYGCPIRL